MSFIRDSFIALARRAGAMLRDRAGGMMVTFALLLPALLGVTGLGVEVGSWYSTRRALQTAADAAALAGAFERVKGSTAGLTAAAKKEAERNGFAAAALAAIAVNSPPSSGPNKNNPAAVEAVLTVQQSLLFSSLFLSNGVAVSARGVAATRVTGTACVLALDGAASKALDNQGSTAINMKGCSIAANSTSADAIDVSGSSTLTAESLWTAGGYYYGGSASMNLAQPAVTNAWPLTDPYAGLTIAMPGGAGKVADVHAGDTAPPLDPGKYSKMRLDGNVTLKPGTYYLDGTNFHVGAQAHVTCSCTNPGDGVTIVLGSSGSTSQIGTVDINGGATIDLHAPSSSTAAYKGILFFQDRRAPTSGTNDFNGGSTMTLGGAIYFPNQEVQWSGNDGTSASACTLVVARLVTFIGNSQMDNSGCAAAGVTPISITTASLVE